MLRLSHARHGRRKNNWVKRRRFKLVADWAVDRLGVQKVVGVNGLWRALPGFDFLLKHTR